MNKKQALVIGATVVGLSTSSIAFSLTETLDRLASENVTAARIFCPYGECSVHLPDGSIDARLSPEAEVQVAKDLALLNSLNVVTGATLVASIAKPEANCYNLVCPEELQNKKAERRSRADKLAKIVEAAVKLQD